MSPQSEVEDAAAVVKEGGVVKLPETEEARQEEGAEHPVTVTTHPVMRAICTKNLARPPGGVVTVTPVHGGTSRAHVQDTIETLWVKLK